MRAIVFHGPGDVRVEDVPTVDKAGPGELLLKVDVVGICGTDAHEFASGPHMFPITTAHPVTGHVGPMIPGHEIAGTVVSVGADVADFREGDLVVSGAGMSCGHCHWCRRGMTNLCREYATLGLSTDGGLAEYVTTPADICVNASDLGISPDVAALGQPMSIAVHAMRRGRLQSDEIAVILGAGGIGAFLTYAVAHRAQAVVVSDLDEERLDIARSLGATYTVRAGGERSVAEVLAEYELIPSVIYEVSGSAAGIAEALRLAPRGCRIVLVGLQGRPYELDARTLSLTELELIGTNAHAVATDLPEALRLLAGRSEGWADIAPLALCFDDFVEDGIRPLAEHRSERIKTLVDPWATRTRPVRQ